MNIQGELLAVGYKESQNMAYSMIKCEGVLLSEIHRERKPRVDVERALHRSVLEQAPHSALCFDMLCSMDSAVLYRAESASVTRRSNR